MPDTVTITWSRPAKPETITVTIPEALVQMLDWVAANVKHLDGTLKYTGAGNVIFAEVTNSLAPAWGAMFRDSQLAAGQATLEAQRKIIDDEVTAGIAAIGVVTT